MGWWNKETAQKRPTDKSRQTDWRGSEIVEAEIVDRRGPRSQLPKDRLRRVDVQGRYSYR
ncbi:MAG: hypothetical protein FD163_1116 [Hyphomonadaceae bacterium]|nr:MAG: hypothetical protein FD163_1116 [Hyphomonadaceae bacterium]